MKGLTLPSTDTSKESPPFCNHVGLTVFGRMTFVESSMYRLTPIILSSCLRHVLTLLPFGLVGSLPVVVQDDPTFVL
jgi:hypothetical protein